jgi:hypothetical protein
MAEENGGSKGCAALGIRGGAQKRLLAYCRRPERLTLRAIRGERRFTGSRPYRSGILKRGVLEDEREGGSLSKRSEESLPSKGG